jgi:hypothetical protein
MLPRLFSFEKEREIYIYIYTICNLELRPLPGTISPEFLIKVARGNVGRLDYGTVLFIGRISSGIKCLFNDN